MTQYTIHCETCNTQYVIVTQDEEPVYCSFCMSALPLDEDEEE